MRDFWVPGMAGPHEDFVARLHREIERFARDREIEKAVVEIELRDGSRFALEQLSPEPGYGFITLTPSPLSDLPDALIVPIGSIGRIELSTIQDEPDRIGFSLPPTPDPEPPSSAAPRRRSRGRR
jgi:hypothetical protein